MATKDGRTQIWYANGNGNVEGYTETVGDIAETIIGTYNEHFGTDIQLWTPETKSLQVGDPIPNWNAYEKIEMPLPNFLKTEIGGGGYIFGEIVDNNFNLSGVPSENKCDIIQDGIKVAISYNLTAYILSVLTPRLESAGYNFNTIQIVSSQYEIGDEIPNWNKFTLIV